MTHYDEYISLGGNCEIGFQFRRYGKEPSSLFSWLVSDIDKIINVLSNDFRDFFEFEDLVPYAHDMVKSTKSGFAFHTAMKSTFDSKKNKNIFIHSEKVRKEFYDKQKSKYLYLIEKWNNLCNSKKKVVYFIKDMHKYSDVQLKTLEKTILNKYPSHKFKIVVIREGIPSIRKSLTANIDICHVHFFSDKAYPAVAILDLDAWSKIYDLYPLKEKRKESIEWIESECKFNRNNSYSLSMNYNLSQFYRTLGFLSNSRYFLEQAKKMSSESFIEEEYLRILKKIKDIEENCMLEEATVVNEFYTLKTEKSMIAYIESKNILQWKYNNKPIAIDIYDEVRYIRLSLQDEVCLHLNEIEVLDLQGNNVALGKSIMMSSTYKQDKPCTNKNFTNGIIDGSPSFHTKTEKNPWVVLDLEDYVQVKSITVHNRSDFSKRALSLKIETSRDLTDWNVIFDNYWFLDRLDHEYLNITQKNVLQSIFKFDNGTINVKSLENDLIEIFKNLKKNKISLDNKLVNYTLLLKIKSFYQIKKMLRKNNEKDLNILHDAVYLSYGERFTFSSDSGLYKMNNLIYGGLQNIYDKEILYRLMKILKNIDNENHNSREYIEFLILIKYQSLARIHANLNKSKNKEQTLQSIDKAIVKLYGTGYILTQHGVQESINHKFNLDSRISIVHSINKIFNILKEKLNIDAYIVSGTLLGAQRDGKFIMHDDDFDSAYISNETNSINIWLEMLQIVEVLPVKSIPIVGGLMHLVVDFDVEFKLDLFTGWFSEGYYYRYPLPTKVLKENDIRPLGKIQLYGVDIATPFNIKASLANNYGENWEIPDPSWRFDWKSANAEYNGCLMSLKDEKISKEWIKNNIPLLNDEVVYDSQQIVIKTNTSNEVTRELKECATKTNKGVLLVLKSYFLQNDIKHDLFIKFVKKNPKYIFRYVGRSKEKDAILEFRGIL